MADIKQIGIAVIGLAIGGGFLFGPMFSYMGITGGSQNGGQDEFNATMPSSNFQEAAFNLDTREQRVLAYNNKAVFVNGFYETEEQRQQMMALGNLTSRFDGRVYVSLANSTSTSDILYRYGLTDFPSVIVVGGNPEYQGQIVRSTEPDEVSGEVCNAFRELGSAASECFN